MWFTLMHSNFTKHILSPAPNPDFVLLLNDFFWLHLAFTVANFIPMFMLRKEFFILALLLCNLG